MAAGDEHVRRAEIEDPFRGLAPVLFRANRDAGQHFRFGDIRRHPVRGKRLEVRLNARAGAGIAAGDGQRDAHYLPRTRRYWNGRLPRASTCRPAARASASTADASTRTPSFNSDEGPGPPCPGL